MKSPSTIKTSKRKNIEEQKQHQLNNSNWNKQSPKQKKGISVSCMGIGKTQKTSLSQYHPHVAQSYNQFITEEGNIIWSGATNLAFNQFKKNLLNGKPLKLEPQSHETKQVIKALNKSTFSTKDISDSAVYIKSGKGSQTTKKINQQVSHKFPNKTTPALNEQIEENDFIAYSYLFKGLQYQYPFQRQSGMMWFGEPLPNQKKQQPYMVEAFAAQTADCLRQIKIIEYTDPYSYVLGFKAKPDSSGFLNNNQTTKAKSQIKGTANSKGDVIYLLSYNSRQDHHDQNVQSIIRKIMEIQSEESIDARPPNQNLMQFVMPVLDFSIKHEYTEFKNHTIQNPQLKGQTLKIIQNINLKMDQKGVVIEEEAFISKDQCAIMGVIQILVNQPFWLVLTEEGKHPYFVAKVNHLPKKQFKNQNQDFFDQM